MELIGKKVNFLGDSITYGVGASTEDKSYINVLKESAGLACARNYGISGTRIARQQKLNPKTMHWDLYAFTERFAQMEDDADIIVVFGGTNDWGHGDAAFGTDADRNMDTFCGALHYLICGLIEKYPAAVICFVTPLHREGDTIPNNSNNLSLKAYVDKIKETAEMYSIPVIDLFATAGFHPDIPVQKELFCPDGVHPNDAGHARVAQRIENFLRRL